MIFLLLACMPDDYVGPLPTGTTPVDDTAAPDAASIAGDWLSEGDDLSDLFAGEPFNYASTTGSFGADGSYTAEVTDLEGTAYPIAGSYTVDVSTDPATIHIVQTAPYEAEADGIWQVAGDVLTYEVVQTTPSYGFTAPTPERGFGSTAGPGLAPDSNVQVYRRQ